jgi:pyruvate-ferredoxin/flavodoxin oxidoreductase
MHASREKISRRFAAKDAPSPANGAQRRRGAEDSLITQPCRLRARINLLSSHVKTAPNPKTVTLDGNEAVASVAYRLTDLFAIYPITPSSPMAESADTWAAANKPNLWGRVPQMIEMQSEAGVAGAMHGALQGGTIASTFTASQGLLLMIPNLYKIAGELTPCCVHVTARTLATHALSIFGDHSDVMACRQTGWAMLASGSPQEAQDLALVSHIATMKARVPFLHFFDGFRTSHEVATLLPLADDTLRAMLDDEMIAAFRSRRMTPDRPMLRGTAQNPDVFFQAREAANLFYARTPAIVQEAMDRFAALTGRAYKLFDYEGHPEADRVVIVMGSGAETVAETAAWLNARGERTGVLKVRLYRPFHAEAFFSVLPKTVRSLAVLDRTKEPGSLGEPLYLDVVAALRHPTAGAVSAARVIGGRYGLASKEFTPAMAAAVFAELTKAHPKNSFTVGIEDDVTHLSLAYDAALDLEPAGTTRAVFFGLGSDGTVGANKNTLKIVAGASSLNAQGYFVYDSKKAGAVTVSHIRFSEKPIRAPYLISQADFVACHQFTLLQTQPVLAHAAKGAVLLLNAPGGAEGLWAKLNAETQSQIRAKGLRVYAIDAAAVAREAGLGGRINTVMQVCFFALARLLPVDDAIARIKYAIEKSYGRQGPETVRKNIAGVDRSLASLSEVVIPSPEADAAAVAAKLPADAPEFFNRVTSVILAGLGDRLPVSAFPPDGTFPSGTARFEKRSLAVEIPVWDATLCIQCNKCVEYCPHAAIRAKFYPASALDGAPAGFHATDFRSKDYPDNKYTIQVAAEDCTGCQLCAQVCPAKDKADPRRKALMMEPQAPLVEQEKLNFDFFLKIPSPDRAILKTDPKHTQFMEPLFEFSGACAGCGETPYVKLLTQLFGDRLVVANATGCSSIYGGNLPTTPYTKNAQNRGPAWSNSLFEDNAEYGLGLRLALDGYAARARKALESLAGKVGDDSVRALLEADQSTEAGIHQQRVRVERLREALAALDTPAARELKELADHLVHKSLWILGGDGWAYDIGFGGLDHVLASGHPVKILVLDTEVYSNTGGQCSKSTPLGSTAKFAAGGKTVGKKDLGLMAMSYGSAYVATISLGARDGQAVTALREAEAYPGPALVIAYSHCVAHGYDMKLGVDQQKLAVDTGYWPLYRYDPRRAERDENPFQLDSSPPKSELTNFTRNELRYRLLAQTDAARAKQAEHDAQAHVRRRFALYQQLAASRQPVSAVVAAAKAEAPASPAPAPKPAATEARP